MCRGEGGVRFSGFQIRFPPRRCSRRCHFSSLALELLKPPTSREHRPHDSACFLLEWFEGNIYTAVAEPSVRRFFIVLCLLNGGSWLWDDSFGTSNKFHPANHNT